MKDCYKEDGYIVCFCGKCEPEDYKLPSDFPMTHNTREVEELIQHFAVEWINRGLDANPQGRSTFLREFFHHQLQKAREEEQIKLLKRFQDILREEDPVVLAGWIELQLQAHHSELDLPLDYIEGLGQPADEESFIGTSVDTKVHSELDQEVSK